MANVPSSIGRYNILKAIGHGGMGTLYLAWDAKLERQIAIKVLKEDDDELRERFAREAKSAARLRHPHIVTVFDLGEHEGQPYIAMEYIHGRTLAQIIREPEDMPLGRTLELMAALCDGLAFAHKGGIIHRDVKPANIMVDDRGSLKILDFGIARLAESAGMTQAGMMIGTLNYMSPEQITGLAVDHRSDIFAVGLVFYELLAQKEAFPGTISTGILGKLLHSEPVPLAQACPGLDPDVIRIVGRAIDKDMNRRYQDLSDMRRDILTVRGHVEAGDGRTVVRETPVPRVPLKSPSERRASERGEIANRRASQIQHYLDMADHAIKDERYDSAIVACEHLLMLDAENTRALDLVDRARAAIEARQAKQLLSQAGRDLQAGSLTVAQKRIDEAGLLHPSAEQEKLREEVERARVARERALLARQAEEAETRRQAQARADSEATIARPSRKPEPGDQEERTVLIPERGATPAPRSARQPAPQPTPRPVPQPVPQPELQLTPVPLPKRSSSSAGMIAAAGVVVVLLAGAAYYTLGPFRSPASAPAQQASTPAAQPPPSEPVSVPSAPPVDPQLTRANELVSEGLRLLGESKLGQARSSFDQAQALAVTPAALNGLAEIDRRQADYTRLWKEGTVAADQKRTKDALSKLVEARTIDPEAFQSSGGPAIVDRLQGQLSSSDRNQAMATAAAADAKRLDSLRKSSIDRFNEGQSFAQQRQYDLAEARYQDAIAADPKNKDATEALGRSERYRKSKSEGLAAFKANDRDGAVRAFGEARNIHSERFRADGLDKTLTEAERLGAAAPQPAAAPVPTDDKSAIAAVLSNLAKSLSTETNKSRDLNVVRRLWPGAGDDIFGDNESQEYVFYNQFFVVVNAATASVDCERARAIKTRSSSSTNITRDNVRIELSKTNAAWQVVSIKERSK